MSLTDHLLRGEADHAALPFRADCPICRSVRLAGPPPPSGLVSPRLAALAATGLVVASGATPLAGAARAAGPDVVGPGGTQSDSGGAQGVNVDDEEPLPGSDDTPVGPPGDDPASDLGPGASAPPADLPADVPLGPPPGAGPQAVDSPALSPPAVPPVALGPEGVPTPIPPAPVAPAAPPIAAPTEELGEPERRGRGTERAAEGQAPQPVSPVTAPTQEGTPASADGGSGREVPVSSPVQAPVGEGSTYVVRSGDTLWGIARRTVGADASMAEIARFVDRLWTLNAKVIRSGDPDLIVPGERLQIPEG